MSLLTQASLILTPTAYKTSKLYSIVPSSGNGDMTVVRATTATRVNSSGLFESVAINVPRLNYDANGSASILLEPQRTNFLLRSQELDNSTIWTNISVGTGVNPIRTANTTISPDGTLTADTLVFDRGIGNTSSDNSTIQQSITIATTGTYYFYVYLKATTSGDIGKQLFIRCGNTGNLQAITLTSTWLKFETTASVNSGSNSFQIGNRGTFSTSNSVSADIWGVQLEQGAYSTSYIPTTTTALTRNLDALSRSNIYTNELITDAGGTWFVELNNNFALTRDTGGTFQIGDLLGNNISIRTVAANSRLAIIKNILNIQTVLYTTLTNTVKIAVDWNGATADVFVNGVKVVTATAFTTTNMNSLTTNIADVPKYIKSIMLFPTPLTDEEMIALTTL